MLVRLDSSALRQTRWNQYALRFLFGGLITALAGLAAKHYGPVVGGLLLAFPAIFPASAILIEKHEKQKKERKGLNGAVRGRQAASIDAAGSAMGSMGLLLFCNFGLAVCGRSSGLGSTIGGRRGLAYGFSRRVADSDACLNRVLC
jgi:hypothetical protein